MLFISLILDLLLALGIPTVEANGIAPGHSVHGHVVEHEHHGEHGHISGPSAGHSNPSH